MLAYVFWHWPQPGVDTQSYVVHLDGFYTQPVEVFPRYIYPLELSFSVEARALTGLK